MEEMKFIIGEDRHGRPLIIWKNPPGLFAEFRPEELKHLARGLLELAEAISENPPKRESNNDA